MECTGERYMPEFDGDWTLEHTHRYFLARELAQGKIVLDAACGDGYGSRLLAAAAAFVFGVDISLDTVVRASAKYPHPRLRFLQGSVTALPLRDNSVDIVASFETIEHLADHEGMLAEIRRVLRPDGMLVMSSPDKYEYSDIPGYHNEYHVKELYRQEFEELLATRFRHVRALGQRVVFGSLVASEQETRFLSWSKNMPDSRAPGLSQAEYVIALAGDAPLPPLPSSIVKNSIRQSDFARDMNARIERLDARLEEAWAYARSLEASVRGLEEDKRELKARLALSERELQNVYASRSWRVTAPLRAAGDFARRAKSRLKAAAPQPDEKPVWPPDVRALERPLDLSGGGEAPEDAPIGVFLHVHYPEVVGEMLDCLRHVPERAKIYVSTNDAEKNRALAEAFCKAGLEERAEIRICPNVGWDIAPFLVGFADRIQESQILLRLHSKRSTQFAGKTGDLWREMLFSSLAGNPGRVNAILKAFADDPCLGMVCPPIAPHYADCVHQGGNFTFMSKLLGKRGIALRPDTPIDFPMGSMFWCRSQVLAPWLELSYADFGPFDPRQRDASLAHALERLFFFGCGIHGYSWARAPELPTRD